MAKQIPGPGPSWPTAVPGQGGQRLVMSGTAADRHGDLADLPVRPFYARLSPGSAHPAAHAGGGMGAWTRGRSPPLMPPHFRANPIPGRYSHGNLAAPYNLTVTWPSLNTASRHRSPSPDWAVGVRGVRHCATMSDAATSTPPPACAALQQEVAALRKALADKAREAERLSGRVRELERLLAGLAERGDGKGAEGMSTLPMVLCALQLGEVAQSWEVFRARVSGRLSAQRTRVDRLTATLTRLVAARSLGLACADASSLGPARAALSAAHGDEESMRSPEPQRAALVALMDSLTLAEKEANVLRGQITVRDGENEALCVKMVIREERLLAWQRKMRELAEDALLHPADTHLRSALPRGAGGSSSVAQAAALETAELRLRMATLEAKWRNELSNLSRRNEKLEKELEESRVESTGMVKGSRSSLLLSGRAWETLGGGVVPSPSPARELAGSCSPPASVASSPSALLGDPFQVEAEDWVDAEVQMLVNSVPARPPEADSDASSSDSVEDMLPI